MKFKECIECTLSLVCVTNEDDGFSVCVRFNRKLFVVGDVTHLMPATCPMQEWVTRRMCEKSNIDHCSTCAVLMAVLREKLVAEKEEEEKTEVKSGRA